MTVGLDGGYVHACGEATRQEGWFEVIVGKSITAQEESKCFAFVHKYDQKPKRRVFEVLRSQGAHAGQPVSFLSDGGETVRNLQLYLNPLGEHLLDWFHVTMRLTVMRQMARGMEEEGIGLADQLEKEISSIKWHLWNGNVEPALRAIDGLQILVENDRMSEKREKLLKAVREFGVYIVSNQQFIPDYGDRRRNGERVSTGFVESAINQVVSKRFVKKQQMRWSPRGAHLLLQVRTQVLNGEYRETFGPLVPGNEISARDGETSSVALVLERSPF
jgi:hypothetical protein